VRILDCALDRFGRRGVDAVSLDEIAREVGVRKQTVLYWFPSKDDLVDEVLAVAAAELVIVIDAALRAAPDDPLDRIDAVVAPGTEVNDDSYQATPPALADRALRRR